MSDDLRGDEEANALGVHHRLERHAYHFSVIVERRAATVAGIDGGIDLVRGTDVSGFELSEVPE